MTTITLRGNILATDTLFWSAGRPYGYGRKLGMSKDGWWMAGAGEASSMSALFQWAAKKNFSGNVSFKDAPGNWEKASVVMLAPNGSWFFFEGHAVTPFHGEYAADGSGAPVALGAMHQGAGAVEAVRASIAHDPGTGGRVEWVVAGETSIRSTARRSE